MNRYVLLAGLAALAGCAQGAARVDEACSAYFGRNLPAFADCAEREGARGVLTTNEWPSTLEIARLYGQGARLAQMNVATGSMTEPQAWSALLSWRGQLASEQSARTANMQAAFGQVAVAGAIIQQNSRPQPVLAPTVLVVPSGPAFYR